MQTIYANPSAIEMWSQRTKCWMCKHKFDEPVLIPVDKPIKGKLQPNINAEVLFHLYDTHGLDPEVVRQWIIGSVYNLELTEMVIK